MTRRALVLLAAAVLLLGACSKKESSTTAAAGGDSTTSTSADEDASSTTTTTAEAEELTEADMAALLLETADLPPGWAASDTPSDSDDGPSDAACPEGQGLDDVEGPEAEGEFSKGQLGPFALQSVIAPDDAEQGMTQTVEAFDVCIGETWDVADDDDGSVTTFTMSELSTPQVGDDSAGYRIVGERVDGTFTMDIVVVRVGDVLTMFGGLSIITELGSFPLDSAEFAELVDTGVAKIAAA